MQTNRQREPINQVLGGYLLVFVNYYQDKWYYLVHLAAFAYKKLSNKCIQHH